MDLALSEEQIALQDSIGTLLGNRFTAAQVRACETDPAAAKTVYEELDALGVGGLLIPEAQGGVGLGAADMVVVQMELGRALVPALYTDSTVGATRALVAAANPECRPEWEAVLTAIASGEARVACALIPGDDAQPVLTTGNVGAILNGTVSFVPEAALAGWLLVAARDTSDTAALCLIKRSATGVEIEGLSNLADQDMAEVTFTATPVAHVVAIGDAASQAIAAGCRALKLAIAAQAVGGAEAIFEMARDYACTRQQFGQPIGAFQAIAHMLAEGAVNIAGAAMLVHRAAAALDEDETLSQSAADAWIDMAKLKACQMFRDVSAMAIQVHGGIGFTLEADPQLFFRRAKHLQLMYGEPLDLTGSIGAAVLSGAHKVLEAHA